MDIFKESQTQKEKFRSAANKLLSNCFLIKKKEETRNDFIFVLQNRSYFVEYFDLLGYKVDINETLGVISLISSDNSSRIRLKKIESILLLIIRLLYIEKRKELSLNEDTVILTQDIFSKYSMLKIDANKSLDKTTLRDTIRLFKKYNLLQNIDRDVSYSDCRIKIYPSILFAVTNENINTLYDTIIEKLKSYTKGGDLLDEEEISQD